MKYVIHAKKIKVTKPIEAYVEEKLGKLDQYFKKPEEIKAIVLIKVNKIAQMIEITIRTNSLTLRAEDTEEDLYAAIDLVVEKLERQIRKNKDRLHSRIKKESIKDFVLDFKEKRNKDKVVKRKTIEMKPIDEEEAILEMNLIGHDFYMFKNRNTNEISVLYRRKDGQYGIIEAS